MAILGQSELELSNYGRLAGMSDQDLEEEFERLNKLSHPRPRLMVDEQSS